MIIANLWRWTHDFDRRVTALFRGGELCAVIPHEVGVAGPSVEDRAQFIVNACNYKEGVEERRRLLEDALADTECGQPQHGSCAFCSGDNTTTKRVWPEDA